MTGKTKTPASTPASPAPATPNALLRINDLDPIPKGAIDFSDNIALDQPKATYKFSLLELRDLFNDHAYPVGSVVMRRDAIDPSTIYGGVWKLIKSQSSLAFGDGTDQSLSEYGKNDITPTLLQHTHGASTTVTINDPGHDHLLWFHKMIAGAQHPTGAGYLLEEEYKEKSTNTEQTMETTRTGITANAQTTIQNSGDSAKLNVRGQRININVWYREQ